MTASEETNARAEASQQPNGPDDSLTRDLLLAARYYLGGRLGLLALLALAAAIGMALNWSWLVAVGLTPVLIAILPCAVMCGLGLCMSRLMGRSCPSDTPDTGRIEPASSASVPAEIRDSSAVPVGVPDIAPSLTSQPTGDDDA